MNSHDDSSMDVYRKAWLNRERQRAEENEKRREQALREARRLRDIITRFPGVRKLTLFGSSLVPGRFSEHSDIDLAVWGLDPAAYFRLLAEIERECPFSVDLIPAEDAQGHVERSIEHGEVLYERKSC